MAQQINLCTPILLTQKRYFSAQTMVQSLSVFVLLGGALCAYWVWSLNAASEGFRKTLAVQARELQGLQAAIAQSKAGPPPQEATLTRELEGHSAELHRREQVLGELQRGLFRPGWGHGARLLMIAQSIPAQVWITEVKADDMQLDVSGYTLDPAALNTWVARLAASPLMQGQRLATAKVENATAAMQKIANGAQPVWSFNLVNSVAMPVVLPGGKP